MTSQFPSAPGALRSPGVKFFIVGLVGFLLLIPASMVWLLVAERQDRASEASREIAKSWGGRQTLAGPFIAVPYETTGIVETDRGVQRQTVRSTAIFLPEAIAWEIEAAPESRKRGIFDIAVYDARVKASGRFAVPDLDSLGLGEGAAVYWQDAVLSLPISDPRAIRAGAKIEIDGRAQEVEPGSGLKGRHAQSGIHIARPFGTQPSALSFNLDVGLKGSDALMVAPGARETRVGMASSWAHPSFTGAYLPDSRDVSDAGFKAEWTISHLALSAPLAFSADDGLAFGLGSDQSFGVRFYQPVDHYALVERSLKYAVLFIGSVFVAVFVLEARSGRSVHVAQYALMGLALVLFYVLLLAFAEHAGFLPAYVIASAATTALISLYCARLLCSAAMGVLVAGLLGAIFGLLYLFLKLEDYALLAGAVFAFVILAIVMFSTLSLDWSGRGGAGGLPPRNADGTAAPAPAE